MERKDKNPRIAVAALVLTLFMLLPLAQAAELFAMKPDDTKCVKIEFGNDGEGKYELVVDDPGTPDEEWVDNHYTSYDAGPRNLISVPVCFSTAGRAVGDEAVIRANLQTPNNGKVIEYGICVSADESVDEIPGSITGGVCEAMGLHTDIFSASFKEPEKYASPGQEVTYELVLDSLVPATLTISQASGDVSLEASRGTVTVGDGPEEVLIRFTAPSETGEYGFSVMVSASGCAIADCTREVFGVVRVEEPEDQPQSGFVVWLTPKTKSVERNRAVQLQILVRNFGPGEEVTISVSAESGVETNFAPYSTFIEKGGNANVPVTVVVTSESGTSFVVTAVAEGADGTSRTAESHLKVDEMATDSDLIDADFDEDDSVATLQEWVDIKTSSPSVDVTDDGFVEPPVAQDYTLHIIIVVVIAAIALVGFYLYRKSQVQEPSWKDLGLK